MLRLQSWGNIQILILSRFKPPLTMAGAVIEVPAMTFSRLIKALVSLALILVGFGLTSPNYAVRGQKSKTSRSSKSICPKGLGELIRNSDDKRANLPERRRSRDSGSDSTSLGNYSDGDGGSSSSNHPAFQDGLIPGTDFKCDDCF